VVVICFVTSISELHGVSVDEWTRVWRIDGQNRTCSFLLHVTAITLP